MRAHLSLRQPRKTTDLHSLHQNAHIVFPIFRYSTHRNYIVLNYVLHKYRNKLGHYLLTSSSSFRNHPCMKQTRVLKGFLKRFVNPSRVASSRNYDSIVGLDASLYLWRATTAPLSSHARATFSTPAKGDLSFQKPRLFGPFS